jgi:MFS family permease
VGGVGLLTGETIYLSLLADFYPPEGLGVIFGSYRFWGQGLGIAAGPLAGVLAAVFGWRSAFVVLALPTFVFVFMLRWLRSRSGGCRWGSCPRRPRSSG